MVIYIIICVIYIDIFCLYLLFKNRINAVKIYSLMIVFWPKD